MVRKGISFTLTILVVSLVLLITALTVMTLQQGYISDLAEMVRGTSEEEFSQIERNQLRNRCNTVKDSYCDTGSASCPSDLSSELSEDQYWVCQAEVEDVPCYELWEDDPGSVPEC